MARAIKRWKIDGALPSPGEGGREVGGGSKGGGWMRRGGVPLAPPAREREGNKPVTR